MLQAPNHPWLVQVSDMLFTGCARFSPACSWAEKDYSSGPTTDIPSRKEVGHGTANNRDL